MEMDFRTHQTKYSRCNFWNKWIFVVIFAGWVDPVTCGSGLITIPQDPPKLIKLLQVHSGMELGQKTTRRACLFWFSDSRVIADLTFMLKQINWIVYISPIEFKTMNSFQNKCRKSAMVIMENKLVKGHTDYWTMAFFRFSSRIGTAWLTSVKFVNHSW